MPANSIGTSKFFKVKAAFMLPGRRNWSWVTWTESESGGNKHAAIVTKAKEIGATSWDFGQAEYATLDRANFTGRPATLTQLQSTKIRNTHRLADSRLAATKNQILALLKEEGLRDGKVLKQDCIAEGISYKASDNSKYLEKSWRVAVGSFSEFSEDDAEKLGPGVAKSAYVSAFKSVTG